MAVGALGGAASARGALEQAALQQIGLVDILDRVGLFADRDGQRGEPDGAAAEVGADRAEDLAVEPVEVHAEGDLPAKATADLFPAYDDDGGLLLVLTPTG